MTVITAPVIDMTRRFCKITAPLLLLFFAGVTFSYAQEKSSLDEVLPGLEDTAVVLYFTARVIESNQEVIWNTSDYKVTISGKPVSLKITGKNIVVVARFTPYINADGNKYLAAQGQVWTDIPHEGVHYYTSIQTIPLEFGEQIFFFPLGSQKSENDIRIEIQLELKPYENESFPQNNLSSENID
ncbi:MAG: hypothetical protein LBV20_05575 [Treponema sp.]|jgi:hypothetical protein|nr:hypothetical protein [Treponema sp.]